MEGNQLIHDSLQSTEIDQKDKSVASSSTNSQQSTVNGLMNPTMKQRNPLVHRPFRGGGNLTIIFSAIFILLAFGLVAFFYYQNQELKGMLAKYSSPSASPTSTPLDPFATWISSVDPLNTFSFKYPKDWQQISPSPTNNTSSVIFKSTDGLYRLTISQEDNLSKKTGMTYTTLDDFIGLPYKVKTLTISGVEARQPNPRAGSESLFKVYFFTNDNKKIGSIELLVGDGNPGDSRVTVETLQIAEDLFDKILSTVKFINTPSPLASCKPRPACLDATPKCMIPETDDMCPSVSPSPNGIACTMEAKLCPDSRTYVGRSGPNCEFAPCPSPR